MNGTIWLTISIVFYALGAIGIGITILLFFKLDIRNIVNNLSGKNAEREIQELHTKNKIEKNNKVYKNTTAPLFNRGNTLDINPLAMSMAHQSKRLDIKDENGTVITEDFIGNKEGKTYCATEHLNAESDIENTIGNEDTVLLNTGNAHEEFTILKDIVITHSDEYIE